MPYGLCRPVERKQAARATAAGRVSMPYGLCRPVEQTIQQKQQKQQNTQRFHALWAL